MEQDVIDAQHAASAFFADKQTAGTQTDAAEAADAAAQAPGDAFSAPQRPTASRVQRRATDLGVTGVAQELAPEGVGVASVATHVLRAGLLAPAVRRPLGCALPLLSICRDARAACPPARTLCGPLRRPPSPHLSGCTCRAAPLRALAPQRCSLIPRLVMKCTHCAGAVTVRPGFRPRRVSPRAAARSSAAAGRRARAAGNISAAARGAGCPGPRSTRRARTQREAPER